MRAVADKALRVERVGTDRKYKHWELIGLICGPFKGPARVAVAIYAAAQKPGVPAHPCRALRAYVLRGEL
jgi:hypothetical protein